MLRSETAANPDRLTAALAGLRRYQEAPRSKPEAPMPAIAEAEGATLRDYGLAAGSGPPILFIPSLINPPNILDLPGRSLLRWLGERGHRPALVDWGWDVERRRALSVAGHVEKIVLPLIESLGERPAVVGYCLGGTMAVAAAQLVEAKALATIAAPWHFSGFEDGPRGMIARLWRESEGTAKALGMLPMEVLQSAFWNLDPARTVGKFETFAKLDPASAEARAFVTLEDWSNDGPPIPEAAAREMFESLFAADLPGTGGWRVAGQTIDPSALPCPSLHIVSTVDRIVPSATAIRSGQRIDLDLGHVGMVIGSKARDRLWTPLSDWLSSRSTTC